MLHDCDEATKEAAVEKDVCGDMSRERGADAEGSIDPSVKRDTAVETATGVSIAASVGYLAEYAEYGGSSNWEMR